MRAAPPQHRFAALLAVATLALLVAFVGFPSQPGARAQNSPTSCEAVTVPLAAGFNLVAVLDAATPATLVPSAGAVFGWDAAARDFRSFASDLPAALNGLGALEHGGAYWVRLRGGELGGPWPPSPGRVGTSVELEEGFNLVAWLGPDGVSLREAVQSLGEALLGAWAWEFGRQQFLSYQPGLPDGLYDDAVIFRGDGIWIRVGSAMRWDQSVG